MPRLGSKRKVKDAIDKEPDADGPGTKQDCKSEDVVYVINTLQHVDDYKRADSDSSVVAGYRDPLSAYLYCIEHNLSSNNWGRDDEDCRDASSTATRLFGKKLKEDDYDELKKLIQTLTDLSTVKNIYTEVLEMFEEQEAEFTMRATCDIARVHVINIV